MEDSGSPFKVIKPLYPQHGRDVTVITDVENKHPCVFCRKTKVDEDKLGPMYMHSGVVVHYFCMLFSAGLNQQGQDIHGILGFLPEDIQKEARRGARLRCSYCHTMGASIGCYETRCKISFHYECGLDNGVNFQFYDNYRSYCRVHSRKRTVKQLPEESKCPICLCNISIKDELIVGSCCKSAIFHSMCIQQHAFASGYFFKCPICSNSQQQFLIDMKNQGVFVPEMDAVWEKEPNAYHELLQQYNHCDADKCLCTNSKGRDYGAAKGGWMLARCRICGSQGIHRQCGNLKTVSNWACSPCLEVEKRTDKEKKTAAKKLKSTGAGSRSSYPPQAGTPISAAVNGRTNHGNLVTNRADQSLVDDDETDFKNITIMPLCSDYFPHSQEEIIKYAIKDRGIPDHRNLNLRIQLVDLLSYSVVGSGGGRKSEVRVTTNSQNVDIKTEPMDRNSNTVNRSNSQSANRSNGQLNQWMQTSSNYSNDSDIDRQNGSNASSRQGAAQDKVRKSYKRKHNGWQNGVVPKRKPKLPKEEINADHEHQVDNPNDVAQDDGLSLVQGKLMSLINGQSENMMDIKVETVSTKSDN